MRSKESETSRTRMRDTVRAGLVAAYVVLGLHGLILLTGPDFLVSGPQLTSEQCLTVAGLYLLQRLFTRKEPQDDEP